MSISIQERPDLVNVSGTPVNVGPGSYVENCAMKVKIVKFIHGESN